MKKIFLSLAVLATLTMASCQPSATKAEDEGAAIKAKIENCQDPDSLKIYVQQAKDYADKLVQEGDDQAAQAYLDEVVPVIQAKDPSVASFFETLKSTADSTLNAAADSASVAVENAKEKASEATEAAKQSASEAANAVKDKATGAVNTVKEKTSDAVNQGKEKAADAVQKGADKLKDALK